jgi:hypothetical protein
VSCASPLIDPDLVPSTFKNMSCCATSALRFQLPP